MDTSGDGRLLMARKKEEEETQEDVAATTVRGPHRLVSLVHVHFGRATPDRVAEDERRTQHDWSLGRAMQHYSAVR